MAEWDEQQDIVEVLLTRSPSRLVGVLRLLPRLRHTRFRGCWLRDDRTWREGVLSLKHRRCNETKEYHRAQQSPHENDWLPGNQNVHGRPPGTKSGSRLPPLYCENPRLFMNILPAFLRSGVAMRDERQRQKRRVAPRPQKCLCRMEGKCLCWLSCITPEMPRSGRKCR